MEEEFFVAGDATAYTSAAPLTGDGMWELTPGEEAAYRTRIIVRRPAEDDFNGTVLVEWLNVSAGSDSDPDWGFLHPHLLREGFAYVGVSAQAISVEGGTARLEIPGVAREALAPLKEWDPPRYEPLSHPGDEWSYGIFSDVAELLRAPGEVDPLDGLRPEHVIALGESQSASRLATYVNGVHPLDEAYDGFLVHSRGATGAPLGPDPALAAPTPPTIRTDLEEPVLQFETETDLIRLRHLEARQPDSDSVHTWEVAGTAHADQTTLDYGAASGRVWNSGGGFDANAFCGSVNTGPQAEVLRAAMAALHTWVVDGEPPAPAPLLEIADGDIARDELGNALGGIRTPAVDAPVAALTGVGNPSSVFCGLFGQTTPLPPERLQGLYDDHDDYVARVHTSADAALAEGHLLEPERDAVVEEAEERDIP